MILNNFYKNYFENSKIFDYKKYIINLKKLFSVYERGYQPPNFILNLPKNKLIKYMKSTIIYYEKEKDKILSFTREPVNITMNRYYNLKKMYQYFGYEKSLYNEKSSNIAIFTKTPIQIKKNEIIEMDINVLNVIGVALDSTKQYDYIRLYKIKNINKRIFEYENMVKSFLIKIKKCFLENNFELLFLSAIGLGNFSILCPLLKINQNEIFNKIFNEVFKDIIENNILNKKIILWCFSDNLLKIINNKNNMNICNLYLNNLLLDINKNNNYYNYIDINKKINIKVNKNKILFINAYDPYSIVGNGNNNDNSLDGYFGRISAMSILCWPFTNPFIKYIKI
jgi:hypothetical protein